MLGAIIGDIVGSLYESEFPKTKDIELFAEGSRLTDDSIMTIAAMAGAIAEAFYGISEEMKRAGTEKANSTIPYYFNEALTFAYPV